MTTDGSNGGQGSESGGGRKHKRLRARVRNKFRLIRKWKTALEVYEGPGYAELLDGYRPQGATPVDRPEIAGLVIQDEDDLIHHLRLYRDGTVAFIKMTENPNAWVAIDPLDHPPGDDTVYLTDGLPPAVTSVLDALDVTPKWSDACQSSAHDFYIENEGSKYSYVNCRKCDNPRTVLSWLGHSVPFDAPE